MIVTPLLIEKIPQYQAHRGYWVEGSQENTIDAFIAAKKKNFLMCELDVQLSKDSVPIVFHDKNLIRLKNNEALVKELTADEIKKMANAPTLEEVLTHSEVTPYFNVEIKSGNVLSEELDLKVSQVVKKCRAENRIILSSFNPFSLARMRYLLSSVPRALLVSQEDDPENHFFLKKMWFLKWAQPQMLNIDFRDIEYSTIHEQETEGFGVGVWTVNDQTMADRLIARGARTIITDQLLPL